MPTVIPAVQSVLDDLVERDVERGLQVAAYLDGRLVLDTWSGLADASTQRLVDGDTLFVCFSCGKGVVATAIHLLAERGRIDYDTPVANYWPAFGANGKAGITVRQVLNHTAGIPQLPPGWTVEDLCNWDRTCDGIAALAPLWQPGSRTGYHARTFGFILGEVVRRVDGRAFGPFVYEELCRPLGIEDIYFGVPASVEPRLARLEDTPPPAAPPGWSPPPLMEVVFPPSLPPTAAMLDQPEVHRASIPSSGGVLNARSLARLYAMLAANGEWEGRRLLSEERLHQATVLQTSETDAVVGLPMNKALGYMLGGEWSPMGPSPAAFGHPGSGGSTGFADPRHRFAFALTKTRLVSTVPGQDAAYLIAEATRAALGMATTAQIGAAKIRG
jgi:CubicO group peptidase (beta-lactamase class C family)